ncbi:MAG: TylF/MycF/NovP-related O-methyltransferase [Patescibacteria group bacterium]
MVKHVKRFLGKSRTLRRIYERLCFLKELFLGDLFHGEKLWLFLRVMPYTMVGYKRLTNVYELALRVEQSRLPGAFVECGVWKGGVAGVMAYVASRAKSRRKIWLFDSFEGLPEPTLQDGGVAGEYAARRVSGELRTIGQCVGPREDVERLFSFLRIPKEYVMIEKGWFQDTLPLAKTSIGPIAILRIDADWYESTKCVLEHLYDNVIGGGFVIVDDYGHWEGCRKAVDEFFHERKIPVELIPIDYTGIYFQKVA